MGEYYSFVHVSRPNWTLYMHMLPDTEHCFAQYSKSVTVMF